MSVCTCVCVYTGDAGEDWSDVEQAVQEAVWPHTPGAIHPSISIVHCVRLCVCAFVCVYVHLVSEEMSRFFCGRRHQTCLAQDHTPRHAHKSHGNDTR